MDFDHYRERGAAAAADVVNTRGSISGRELIDGTEALARFLVDHGIDPDPTPTAADVESFRRLRDRLHRVFFASDDAATAELLNAMLRDWEAAPRVAPGDGGWRLEFASLRPDPVTELGVLTTVGLAALFSQSRRTRFGVCSAHDCRDVFIDTSRNRSRRYCADSCSSRTNVAAFRARQRFT